MISWWNGLTGREQRLVLGGGISLLIAVLYWGVWQPLSDKSTLAENRIVSERQLLNWVKDKADDITTLRSSGNAPVNADQALNRVIPTSTRRFKIELIRMQPRDDMMQVWVKPLPFNSLINWLAFLRDNHGIQVEFIDMNKTDVEGMVEVNRLQLSRG